MTPSSHRVALLFLNWLISRGDSLKFNRPDSFISHTCLRKYSYKSRVNESFKEPILVAGHAL